MLTFTLFSTHPFSMMSNPTPRLQTLPQLLQQEIEVLFPFNHFMLVASLSKDEGSREVGIITMMYENMHP